MTKRMASVHDVSRHFVWGAAPPLQHHVQNGRFGVCCPWFVDPLVETHALQHRCDHGHGRHAVVRHTDAILFACFQFLRSALLPHSHTLVAKRGLVPSVVLTMLIALLMFFAHLARKPFAYSHPTKMTKTRLDTDELAWSAGPSRLGRIFFYSILPPRHCLDNSTIQPRLCQSSVVEDASGSLFRTSQLISEQAQAIFLFSDGPASPME